jgi:hypothetical protein
MLLEAIGTWEKIIEYRTRDLQTGSLVSQPTTLPRPYFNIHTNFNLIFLSMGHRAHVSSMQVGSHAVYLPNLAARNSLRKKDIQSYL